MRLNIYTSDHYLHNGLQQTFKDACKSTIQHDISIIDCRIGPHIVNFLEDNTDEMIYLYIPVNSKSLYKAYYQRKLVHVSHNLEITLSWLRKVTLLNELKPIKDISLLQQPLRTSITKIEADVISLSFQARSLYFIADRFHLSVKTIYAYRQNCIKKLGFRHFNHFCIFLFRTGLKKNIFNEKHLSKLQKVNNSLNW